MRNKASPGGSLVESAPDFSGPLGFCHGPHSQDAGPTPAGLAPLYHIRDTRVTTQVQIHTQGVVILSKPRILLVASTHIVDQKQRSVAPIYLTVQGH
jgi:hypothetical protein